MEQDDLAGRLSDFYRRNPPDLGPITDVNRRHFRLLLPNGRFHKVKDIIRSPEDLQERLVKLRPLDVYYSTSTYLNPTLVAPRPKRSTDYWGPGNIVLRNDLSFDLDRQPLSLLNLERARKDAVALLDAMSAQGHELKYAAFSGSKGFHLIFADAVSEIEPDMREREKAIIRRRKEIADVVTGLGIRIDAPVTVDTRRIIRLPGTVNSKTGYCCQVVPEDRLRSPVADWIDDIPGLEGRRRVPRFTWKLPAKGKRAAGNEAPGDDAAYGFTTFITSSVLGTKGRHAVLLSLPKGPLESAIERLERAQSDLDLTDIYIFELPRSYQVICLKTVQRNRYQKILDSVRSPSAGQLRSYDRVSLRMGPLVDRDMREIEPSARFVSCIECPPDRRARNFASRGHAAFLKKHGFAPMDHPLAHGSGEFKLVDAMVRI